MGQDHPNFSSSMPTYRFGNIAVSRGYVSLDKVQRALAEQIEDDVMRRPHRRLGVILQHDWITKEQMQMVLDVMGVDIEEKTIVRR